MAIFPDRGVNSIRGNAATTLAAVVTVLIVTFLLGVTVTVGKWVYDYTNGVRNDITMKAYVSTSDYGSNDQKTVIKRGNLMNEIKQLPYVKTVTYVSPAAALKTVSPSMRESAEQIGYNPFPPSFWLKLTDPVQGQRWSPTRSAGWHRRAFLRCAAVRDLRLPDHQAGAEHHQVHPVLPDRADDPAWRSRRWC